MGIAHHYKEVLNRLISAISCLSSATFAPRDIFLGTVRTCSFRQVISSRQGGATSNLKVLHCWIEKQLCKQDRLQRHVAIATLLPGIDGTDLKWMILIEFGGCFTCVCAFNGLFLGLIMQLWLSVTSIYNKYQLYTQDKYILYYSEMLTAWTKCR